APLHCALMKPAQDRLAPDLAELVFNEPAMPVVTNVDARITTAPDQLRNALVRQVSAPVRWVESMQLLMQEGVDTFIEAGPGKVLSGMIRQINRESRMLKV